MLKTTEPSKTLKWLFFSVILIVSLVVVCTYFLSMGLGIVLFFFTADGQEFSRGEIVIHPLLLRGVEVNVNAGLFFLFLWGLFIVCFIIAWKYRESPPETIRRLIRWSDSGSSLRNNLVATPLMGSMLLMAMIVLDFLQTKGGIPTGELPLSDPFLELLLFSQAPLIEEMIFRIIPLGTVLAFYIFVAGRGKAFRLSFLSRLKTAIFAVFQPEEAKQVAGLRNISGDGWLRGLTLPEWVMVLFTSSLFGIAHFYGGWGPGKISQAALSGLVFALAYLYYGIQAPLLLHWYFNYYFTVFDLSSKYYSPTMEFAYYFTFSINLLLGIFGWVTLIFLVMFIVRKRFVERRHASPTVSVIST